MKAVIEMEVDVINDLIRINNDRIEGYRKASEDLKPEDADLKPLFSRMMQESREYIQELRASHPGMDDEAIDETTNKGKLYRAWMDVKATFTGHDRHSLLAACEYGEDAAQKAYETAMEDEDPVSSELYNVISMQKSKLRRSHDQIKTLRDRSKK